MPMVELLIAASPNSRYAVRYAYPNTANAELRIPAERYMTFRPEAVKMKKELINLNYYPIMKGG